MSPELQQLVRATAHRQLSPQEQQRLAEEQRRKAVAILMQLDSQRTFLQTKSMVYQNNVETEYARAKQCAQTKNREQAKVHLKAVKLWRHRQESACAIQMHVITVANAIRTATDLQTMANTLSTANQVLKTMRTTQESLIVILDENNELQTEIQACQDVFADNNALDDEWNDDLEQELDELCRGPSPLLPDVPSYDVTAADDDDDPSVNRHDAAHTVLRPIARPLGPRRLDMAN